MYGEVEKISKRNCTTGKVSKKLTKLKKCRNV